MTSRDFYPSSKIFQNFAGEWGGGGGANSRTVLFFPLQSSHTTCGAALLDPQSSSHPIPCLVKGVELVINFMKIIRHECRSIFVFFSLNGAKNTKDGTCLDR